MISTFNLIKLNALLEDFYALSRIRITVFDENFNELAAYPEHISPICQIIRTDANAHAQCRECDRHACQTAARRHKAYTYRCHAGLTESIAPLYMGNVLIGYLLFGHVFSFASHEEGWEELRNRCSCYEIDLSALKTACDAQPVIPDVYIASASHILQAVACYLCMERMVSLHQQELPVQIDHYITEHYLDDIRVSDLCGKFGIGKTFLYEMVKQNYGVGLAEYIRKLRIEKAKELLLADQSLSLAEIAALCGFKDYNYFITVFKRVEGISPKKFQQKERNSETTSGSPENSASSLQTAIL